MLNRSKNLWVSLTFIFSVTMDFNVKLITSLKNITPLAMDHYGAEGVVIGPIA